MEKGKSEIVEFRKIRIEYRTEYYHVLDYLLLQIQFLDQSHLQVFQGQYRFLYRVAHLATGGHLLDCGYFSEFNSLVNFLPLKTANNRTQWHTTKNLVL